MGLQFGDAPHVRPLSAVAGEPRRFRGRIPGAAWLGVAIVVALGIVYLARQIILPFVLAIFLTYLLLPLVNAMSAPTGGRRGTPRVIATFLALAAFIGVLVVAILLLAPLVAGEASRLGRAMFSTGGNEPALAHRLAATFQAWRDTIYGTGVFSPDVERQLDQEVRDVVAGLDEAVGNMVQGSFALFPMLLELIAIISFFLQAVPFFGPLIWGALAVVLALAQAGPGNALPIFVGVFALLAQQVDSHVFAPWILGRFTRVHPLLLIFGTLLGASLFGLIGMFLAAPITALAKETFLFALERVKVRRGTGSLSVSA